MLKRSDLDILTLGETFLNYSVDNTVLDIEGSNLYCMDRDGGSGKRGGGGLCVYANNKYKVSHLVDKNLCTPDIEIMWVLLELRDTRKTYIVNVYRRPDGKIKNFLEFLELQTLNINTEGNSDIVIMGYVNIDLAKQNHDTKLYRDALHTLHLNQIISDFTRVTETTKTRIDHICVNRTEMYYVSGTLELGLSDHSLIYTV